MVPTIFSGAMYLMAEFGTRQNPWPVTYETWLEHVLPVLEEPIKTLTEASQCESAYDHQDRTRIERKLYQMHPTALLLEFCRVDPEKATTFINRLLGGKHRAPVRPHPEHQRLDPERSGQGRPRPGTWCMAPHTADEAHQRVGVPLHEPQPTAASRGEEARNDPPLEPDLVARIDGKAIPRHDRGQRHKPRTSGIRNHQ